MISPQSRVFSCNFFVILYLFTLWFYLRNVGEQIVHTYIPRKKKITTFTHLYKWANIYLFLSLNYFIPSMTQFHFEATSLSQPIIA